MPTPRLSTPLPISQALTFNLPAPISRRRPDASPSTVPACPSATNQRETSPNARPEAAPQADTLTALSTLKPLGQLRDSLILAANEEGLWIVDQHVAHERVLLENSCANEYVEKVQRQRLPMPVLIDLLPEQMITFAEIAEELDRNGFEPSPSAPAPSPSRLPPLASKASNSNACSKRSSPSPTATAKRKRRSPPPPYRRLHRLPCGDKNQSPLEPSKIDWLLTELSKTEHPTACPQPPHRPPLLPQRHSKSISAN